MKLNVQLVLLSLMLTRRFMIFASWHAVKNNLIINMKSWTQQFAKIHPSYYKVGVTRRTLSRHRSFPFRFLVGVFLHLNLCTGHREL